MLDSVKIAIYLANRSFGDSLGDALTTHLPKEEDYLGQLYRKYQLLKHFRK
jgi:hypothetical protein